MTWVKLDDALPRHPKVIGLGAGAKWAYVEALCYCGQYNTDGRFPRGLLPAKDMRALLAARLIVEDADGYRIPDFLEFNPSREKVEEDRRKARERAAKGGRSSPEVRPKDSSPAPARPDPGPKSGEAKPAAKAAPENGNLAETLLAADSRSMHFLRALRNRTGYETLTDGGVMKLGIKYGAPVVVEALSYVYEEGASPLAGYPYLESVCVRITAERGAA